MKKDLAELNRKIRHSRKKHDNVIRRRNNLRKATDEMVRSKPGPEPTDEYKIPEFKEIVKAFSRAFRSYRVEGIPKTAPDTFKI